MLNQMEIYANWPLVREKILKHWNRLTPGELDQTDGRLSDIIKLVQKNYGSSEDFEEDFEDICWYCECRMKNRKKSNEKKLH